MKDLSFLDKLKVLVDVSSSSGLCIASIVILVFLAIIMLTTSKKNSKQTKLFYILIYIALLVVMLIQYGSSFSTMFDYMMNNLFIAVYFPNLAIYLAAIIATNIILWKTIFNFKEDRLLKVVNTIIYCIMHYLLVLIMNVVTSSGINVFDNSSVYSNNQALALIGLSSTIFMIWIIFIIIYKIIRSSQKNKENEVVRPILPSNIIETAVPKKVREIIEYKEINMPILPSNILEIVAPRKVREVVKYKEVERPKFSSNIEEVEAPEIVKDMRPKIKPNIDLSTEKDSELEKYENMLTLDDYKRVLDILKNNKVPDDTITIDNNIGNESSSENKNTINITNESDITYSYEANTTKTVLDQLLNL